MRGEEVEEGEEEGVGEGELGLEGEEGGEGGLFPSRIPQEFQRSSWEMLNFCRISSHVFLFRRSFTTCARIENRWVCSIYSFAN